MAPAGRDDLLRGVDFGLEVAEARPFGDSVDRRAAIDAAKKVVPTGRRHLATLPHRERPER